MTYNNCYSYIHELWFTIIRAMGRMHIIISCTNWLVATYTPGDYSVFIFIITFPFTWQVFVDKLFYSKINMTCLNSLP